MSWVLVWQNYGYSRKPFTIYFAPLVINKPHVHDIAFLQHFQRVENKKMSNYSAGFCEEC